MKTVCTGCGKHISEVGRLRKPRNSNPGGYRRKTEAYCQECRIKLGAKTKIR